MNVVLLNTIYILPNLSKMNLKTFTIELTDVALLQKCLGISSGLHANKIINLLISQDQIQSTTSNAVDSCYKHWVVDISKIGTSIEGEEKLITPIKCSIFKGPEFAAKILNQVNVKTASAKLIFYYDDVLMNVKQIEVVSTSIEKKKKIFSLKFATSDVSILYTNFDEETIQMFFTEESPSTKLYEFKLLKDDLKNLRLLLGLDVHDDTQNNFIAIKLNENSISFTDQITDFNLDDSSILHPISEELTKKAFNIDKDVFKLIETSEYIVQLREEGGVLFIVLFNTNGNFNYVTAIPLLETISSTVSYEDVLKDTGKFG